ncbi:MAG TPA: hypothetical protein VKP30_26780, partial [Polyangiaceae bacterium]|nr:hypothetical protein [Polyangiaceae bacterium]
MSRVPFLALSFLVLVAGCADPEVPSGKVYFLNSEGSALLQGVSTVLVDRVSPDGKTTKVFKGTSLPESIDMGKSGNYRFRLTGSDENGLPVLGGETFSQEVSGLLGVKIPMLLARRDRLVAAPERLNFAPGATPQVGIYGGSALWVWSMKAAEQIETDGYSFAYWQQVTPALSDSDADLKLQNIDCPTASCEWKNLIIVGGFYAIAIADGWASLIDTVLGTQDAFAAPATLSSFADVAGGTVLPAANSGAVLIGGTRLTSPTASVLSVDQNLSPTVISLSTPRAGAAALFEAGPGLVIAGGSSTGPGVERLGPGESTFTALAYPPDPVVGAALVMTDATHLLRVGGRNPDGTAAATAQLDLSCAPGLCALVPMPNLN